MGEKRRKEDPFIQWKITYKSYTAYQWGTRESALENFVAVLNIAPEAAKKIRMSPVES
jgi:hypothetical protein